jgi:superfamily II RNA helicase
MKGYVHWDRATFERLQSKPPEPLESRFDVTHGLLLNLLQSDNSFGGGGYRRLMTLIGRSHSRDAQKARYKRAAAQAFRRLRGAALIELVKQRDQRGRRVQVSPDLQKDFSLNHTLSLWLLDTLPKVPRESETYALDVLSLVEAILENPMPVLYAQTDRAKTEKLAELKAQGMDYADRIKELENVSYPKPHADFIYATFNEFAAKHPWVGDDNIRPKSVAREMVERSATFNEYVRDYGLQRSEGVLLRYLSDAYKTLVQNVPETARSEELDDVIAFLRAAVRGVDSSLLDEWERRMEAPAPLPLQATPAPQAQPARTRDLAADPRALVARAA